jgi:AraC-like DNA-binding protein
MKSNVPLIRLSAINPFLMELRKRGADATALLEDLELPTDIPASHELFVISDTIYTLVERSGELAGDPYLGFTIGSSLELRDWDPIAEAAGKANTVGELLTLFALHASEHSSATRFYLHTDAERSAFGFERVKNPPVRPGQNDAFYMGLMSRLLRHAMRDLWDPGEVLFRIAEPKCVPSSTEPYRVARGERSGVRISFPSVWLFEKFEKTFFHAAADTARDGDLPRSLVGSIRSALQPHLHDPNLTVEKAAMICGYSRRRLSRELRQQGTTISKEIARLRSERASKDLSDTNRRVAEIAQTVGFADPTVFSRAFKNWTGQSPLEYRRNHKSPN